MPCPLHRPPTTHELKCWPEFFRVILSGEKTFEVRKNDRDFMATDWLRLREWDHRRETYTGREVYARVPYLLDGQWPGLAEGYVVMSIIVQGTIE